MNKLWSTLFNAESKPDTWIRATSATPPVALASKLFYDADLNIRGWLVEAVTQLTLQTPAGEELIQKYDPVNNYRRSIGGPKARFTIDDAYVITGRKVDYSGQVYRQPVTISVDTETGASTIIAGIGDPVTAMATVTGNRIMGIPYSKEGTVDIVSRDPLEGVITVNLIAEVLPAASPLDIFRRRFVAHHPNVNKPQYPVTDMALFVARQVLETK